MQLKYRYICEDVDDNGNVRLYFRRRGCRKVRIRERSGTAEFAARYHALLAEAKAGKLLIGAADPDRIVPGTFRWLVTDYVASATFAALDPGTQRVRRQNLEHCCNELVRPDAPQTFAAFPLNRMTTKALAVLRDRKRALPSAALNRVKALRTLFAWGLDEDKVNSNLARDLAAPTIKTDGFRMWSAADVEKFEARHPIGTRARLALAILLFTGMRRSDVVDLGRQHVVDEWIRKPQFKNRNRKLVMLEMPMLPGLRAVIDASPTGELAFLVTEAGNPFTANGFGNWFRDRCNEAGLTGIAAHGMRKAGATVAAENGATASELMAIFGWSKLAHAELYTRAADRKRMAKGAMGKMVRRIEK
jgi:integrase